MAGFQRPVELLLREAVRKSGTSIRSAMVTSDGNSYRAAVLKELGKPLVIQDIPKTYQLDNGMVRVAVKNAAVNFSDILMIQGKYQNTQQPPFTPGTELSGQVVEVGPAVTNVRVGDRVFGLMQNLGAFAEEALIPCETLGVLPDTVSYVTAASFLSAYCTSYMAFTRAAQIKKGDTVLVTAAAGATGLAAVDLAANVFGCKQLVGVTKNVKLLKPASASINYNKESLKTRIIALTEGKGANIIFECVGGKLFRECLSSIAFEGTILPIGFASGEIPSIPANLILVKNINVAGIWWGVHSVKNPKSFKDSIEAVGRYLSEGKIKPHVSKVFPLDQVNEAITFITDRKSTGKVLIEAGKSK